MKYIIAIIQPSKLDAVRDALSELGMAGITVSEVQGYGRQKGKKEIYRGAEYEIHFLPKIKIEIAIPAKMEKQTIEAIKTASHTGRIGDGKLFVFDIKHAIRIRTGETDESAI
ncbi:MAG: P-II family nitrogen regulator [Candidatus Puniceispirillaceae bacterium]